MPIWEYQIAQQGLNIIEKCAASTKRPSNLLIHLISDLGDGMQEKGKQIQGEQGSREVLLTVTEVVVEVVTVVFEHIVVFILALPTGTTTGDNL
jgi:hypothetical protein